MKRLVLLIFLSGILSTAWAQQLPPVYEALEKYYHLNAFDDCIKMESEVRTFSQNRLDTLVSNSFFYLGDAYNQLGEIKKALTFFELEKETLYRLSLTHTTDFSNSLNNLAYLYLQEGNYIKAGSAADEVVLNDRKNYPPAHSQFVESVLYVTDIYMQLDRFQDAENLLISTLKAQEKNSTNRGVLLNKLGDFYSYTGEFTKSSRLLLEAIDIHSEKSGEESPEYISTAINLGVLFMNQGKYPEAEEIFEVALSKMDASEPAYAAVLNNQALIFQNLGQLDRAEKTLHQIKNIDSLTVGTLHPDYAITLSNLGLVYADLGKYKAAELALFKALSIQMKTDESNTSSFARKLNNMAKVHQMSGTPLKAIPLLEQALAIFLKTLGKESTEYATTAYNLGLAYWKVGNEKKGYKYLLTSASTRLKLLGRNHPKYAESLLKIAEYQWYKKEIKKAQKTFGDVFENFYYQIDETFPVLTEEEKSKFYYTRIKDSFDKFNSFAIANKEENPSLVKDVYNYLINTKASIMFATEKVNRSIKSSGDTLLIKEFEQWQSAKEQIARLYSLNQEHDQLDSLLSSANLLEKELTRKSITFARQFIHRKYSWEEIQKTLKPGEAAVEVMRLKHYNPQAGGLFTQTVGYAFLVITSKTKNQPEMILIDNGNEMEGKFLNFYRNGILYNLADVYSYKNYFEPLADYLNKENITRVFFSPDGVYNQINVNTIENPFSKKYLIDEFDFRMVTNTRELADVKITTRNDQSSILIGYPKFNLDENQLPRKEFQKKNSRGIMSRGKRDGLIRYMRGEEGISVLPGTQTEIKKISELLGGNTTVYMEHEASERQAKSVNSPSVLHIATHGFFLEDETALGEDRKKQYIPNPLLNAGLILAGAENFLKTGDPINEDGDDGILTAFEAMNLDLDQTDLVVLSACETGLGDVKNGEGVYGLQRAFKLAGARSIIMSLWNVDDDATQQLMSAFYEALLLTRDQHLAFRTAQQKVKEKYPRPFYWGAFIMVGI